VQVGFQAPSYDVSGAGQQQVYAAYQDPALQQWNPQAYQAATPMGIYQQMGNQLSAPKMGNQRY
jgi:hypothetical protein